MRSVDEQSKKSVGSVPSPKVSVKSVAPKKLVLIDASALIYRAYYALPPLTTKEGMLVNAVYGFTSALFHAIKNLHPEYIVVALDSKGPTFRHKEYKEYKATRPKAPENLIGQIPLVREVCKILNIPVFEWSGYEADDLIGTIVKKLQVISSKLQVMIVTGDMDTLQLVDQDTKVYSMARGVNRAVIYDPKEVKEKYGFDSKRLTDYKALRGDPSDNIPGVPGIGEKTATQLIKEFGTIDNLYEYIEKNQRKSLPRRQAGAFHISVNPRLLVKLKEDKKQAFLSKHLATLVCDIPIKFKLVDCKVHDYDQEKAIKFFKKLEFKSLINRLPISKQTKTQDSLF